MTAFRKAEALAGQRYDQDKRLSLVREVTTHFRMTNSFERSKMRAVCRYLADALDRCTGSTLQQRWTDFEKRFWPKWKAGVDRRGREYWTWGARVLISARMIAPSLDMLSDQRVNQWISHLPEDHTLAQQHTLLLQATDSITWTSAHSRQLAVSNGLRILLMRGYDSLHHIKDDDLKLLAVRWSKGTDALDAALCSLGVFSRTPKRGSARHGRRQRMTALELVENAGVPDRFQQVVILYLETYESRVSDVYRTLRHKAIALAHFWRFIRDKHPSVKRCSEILPRHVRDYIPHAIARARVVQRGPGAGEEVRPTAHSWLVELRVFFSDICAWATEPDSPFKRFAPRTIPVTRHMFLGYGFEKARERTRARITATVLDLEREMPKIRAFALQRWKAAVAAPKIATTRGYPWSDEVDTFWDWALLELLVQSGLRIEEASELTTFDILKRKMPDARIYYLLHIKPSKFDRARVIPIGDGLGRVLAEIIRYVKTLLQKRVGSGLRSLRPPREAASPPGAILDPGHSPSQHCWYSDDSHPHPRDLYRRGSPPLGRFSSRAAASRLSARLCVRTSEQQHACARHSSAARSRLSRHGDDLCQALPQSTHRGVSQDRAQSL